MNTTTTYSNVMLTIIAVLLCVLAFEIRPNKPEGKVPSVQDVNIVGATKNLPVSLDLAASHGSPLEVTVVGTSRVVLSNPSPGEAPLAPLDVRFVGATADLPVLVKNQPASATQPSGPIDVKLVGTELNLPVFVVNPNPPAPETPRRFDVNIVGVGGYDVNRIGSLDHGTIPVVVSNTVDTNIVSPLATSNYVNKGVGVIMLNR